MKKKFTTTILAFLLALNLTACQNQNTTNTSDLENKIISLENDNNNLNRQIKEYEEDIKKFEETIENLNNQIEELNNENELLDNKLKEVEKFMRSSYNLETLYVVKITNEDGESRSIITTSKTKSVEVSEDYCKIIFKEHTLPEDIERSAYETTYLSVLDNVEVAENRQIYIYVSNNIIAVCYMNFSNQYASSNTQKQYFFYDKNEYEEYEESFGGIIEIQELRKILPINETNPSYTIVELQELENELNNNPKLLLEP